MVAKCKIFMITRILVFPDFLEFRKCYKTYTTLADHCLAKKEPNAFLVQINALKISVSAT